MAPSMRRIYRSTFWRVTMSAIARNGTCSATEAVQRLRQHPESGELLNQLEKWLHQPPGTTDVDVQALLEPYRSSAPIQEDELITAETV